MTVRSAAKRVIAGATSRIDRPILVNSFGRSGSTLLYAAIVDSAVPDATGPIKAVSVRAVGSEAWDLTKADLAHGMCFKTHDYPAGANPHEAIVLYTFGDPVTAAASALRMGRERQDEDWYRLHCRHLRVPEHDPDALLDRDGLGFRDHLRSWLAQQDYTVAMIRYETMWDHVQDISDFVGFPVSLPARRERQGAIGLDADELARLRATHRELRASVEALPDFFIVRPGGARPTLGVEG
jgi:hypothetical protein